MELIDSHCHLQFEKLASDINSVLKRSRDADVRRMICVGTTLEDSLESLDMAKNEGVWAAAGVHPHDADDFLDDKQGPAKLVDLLKAPKMVAVGEIGLDYFKNYTSKMVQERALRVQIETGLPSGLPFIFHVRDAWEEFWRIFDEYKGLRGVVHSFSAHPAQLDEVLSRGLYVGLNGIMTFTNDERQLEAARRVPPNRLMLETDAPFLAPKPYRGQVCEPAHTAVTAEFLARLRGEPIEDLSKASTNNAEELFGLR